VSLARASTVLFLTIASGATALAQTAAHIGVTARARSIRPGELVVLTITPHTAAREIQVHAFSRDIHAYQIGSSRWQALVGIDLTTTPGTYNASISASIGATVNKTTYPLVVRARSFPTRTLTVDEGFVNPPPEAVEQIERDTETLNRIWAASAQKRLWSGPFERPVPDPANSRFGSRSILNGQPRSPHSGADFLSPEGRPVKAPNAGRVVFAGPLYFTGNTVIVDHGLGLFSLFAHLSKIDVHEGGDVTTGEVIGEVGATGRVTGPHLHWTVRVNGARVDPLSLLEVLGQQSLIPHR
jgi:murein DD-endopeptidase MepM/ murein hydrolase activator NlpD